MNDTKKFRILAMGDTHDLHKNLDISTLPEADIFIHAGDFTQNSYRGELNRFMEFLDKLPYKHKIVIAGNHDFVYDVENYQNKHKPKRHPHEKLDAKV
jgi:predicted phosphodiesterase